MEIPSKKLFLIGSLAYLSLLILAIIFYKERVIIFDMAYHTFEIVRTGDFAIQCQRFGATLTQIFPLIGVKLGLPLKAVMILYSVAFVIYHFSAFLITLFYFKNRKMSLVILLFSILIVTHTFYWIQSELIQGVIFLLLFYGFLLKKEKIENCNVLELAIIIAMIITLVFFHPIISIPFIYFGLFFLLSEEKINSKLIFASTLIFMIVLIVKGIIFPPTDYDAGRISSLEYFQELFPDYFTLPINVKFLKFCLRDYYFLLIFLITASVFYIQKKKTKKLLLLLIFFFGFLLLINVTSYQWPEQFYLESFYLCLSLFVIAPMVFDLVPRIRNKKLLYILLIVVIFIRVTHIGLSHHGYSARLAWNEKLLSETDKYPSKKLIISQSKVPMDILKLSWSSSFELLLLSSMESPKSSRCLLVDEEPERFNWTMDKNKSFFTEWTIYSYEDLPKDYFNPQDTSYYKIIP